MRITTKIIGRYKRMGRKVFTLATFVLVLGAIISIYLLVWIRKECIKSKVEYALLLDAGSSGTRLYVYRWEERGSKHKLPEIR